MISYNRNNTTIVQFYIFKSQNKLSLIVFDVVNGEHIQCPPVKKKYLDKTREFKNYLLQF